MSLPSRSTLPALPTLGTRLAPVNELNRGRLGIPPLAEIIPVNSRA